MNDDLNKLRRKIDNLDKDFSSDTLDGSAGGKRIGSSLQQSEIDEINTIKNHIF